jgi:hypothetical protein
MQYEVGTNHQDERSGPWQVLETHESIHSMRTKAPLVKEQPRHFDFDK